MPNSDTIAIAAHLHVLLRRNTGRVTDTEWMAANADYAREIIRFSRQHAQQDNLPELAEWADRLDHVLHAASPATARRPLLDVSTQAVRQRIEPPPPPELPRYVGGIR